MKKFLAAVLSLSLCGAMLTSCGGSGEGTDTGLTESQTSSATETTKTETEAETETETETETDTATETEAKTEGSAYASIDEFAKDSEIFSLPTETVSAADSLTYGFVKTLEGATEFYMDVESTDGGMAMIMALSGKDVYMKVAEASSDENLTIIIKDSVMYMMDDEAKSGYYFTADEETMSEYNVEELLGELDIDKEIEEAEDVKTCKVTIDGKEYTFETAETGGGFLFDNDKLLIPSPETNLTRLSFMIFPAAFPLTYLKYPPIMSLSTLKPLWLNKLHSKGLLLFRKIKYFNALGGRHADGLTRSARRFFIIVAHTAVGIKHKLFVPQLHAAVIVTIRHIFLPVGKNAYQRKQKLLFVFPRFGLLRKSAGKYKVQSDACIFFPQGKHCRLAQHIPPDRAACVKVGAAVLDKLFKRCHKPVFKLPRNFNVPVSRKTNRFHKKPPFYRFKIPIFYIIYNFCLYFKSFMEF